MMNGNTRSGRSKLSLLALVLIGGLLLAAAGLAQAGVQATVVDWWVLAGGGGHSAGGNVALDATLGQPIAGESAGGNVALGAGYWYGAQAHYILYLPNVLRIPAATP